MSACRSSRFPQPPPRRCRHHPRIWGWGFRLRRSRSIRARGRATSPRRLRARCVFAFRRVALLQAPRRRLFLTSEVPLYPEGPKFDCQHMERDLCACRHETETPATARAIADGPMSNLSDSGVSPPALSEHGSTWTGDLPASIEGTVRVYRERISI